MSVRTMPPPSWLMAKRPDALVWCASPPQQTTVCHLCEHAYKSKAEDPFAQRSGELNAPTACTRADAGYLLWYDVNTQRSWAVG
jgi:hypothetical protein